MSSSISIDPAFSELKPPTIIVGMHRSGTSMLAGIMHALGVYLGPELNVELERDGTAGEASRAQGYGESVAFRDVNKTVMLRAGSSWWHVDNFIARRDIPQFRAASVKYMAEATAGILKSAYLDRRPKDASSAWSWKDPRNSITLTYWLQLFPQARVLHVLRSPQSVLKSLQRRDEAKAAKAATFPQTTITARIKKAAASPGGIARSIRRKLDLEKNPICPPGVMSSNDWLKLTELHVRECRKFEQHPGGYLEVSYEELIQATISYVNLIADFVGANPTDTQIDRAYAFVQTDLNTPASTAVTA